MQQFKSVLASVLRVQNLRIEQLGCGFGPATDLGLDPEIILQLFKQLFYVTPDHVNLRLAGLSYLLHKVQLYAKHLIFQYSF